MIAVYHLVLIAAVIAVLALVGWRIHRLTQAPRPAPGRMLNEWAWTLVPLLVLGALLWQALGWHSGLK